MTKCSAVFCGPCQETGEDRFHERQGPDRPEPGVGGDLELIPQPIFLTILVFNFFLVYNCRTLFFVSYQALFSHLRRVDPGRVDRRLGSENQCSSRRCILL